MFGFVFRDLHFLTWVCNHDSLIDSFDVSGTDRDQVLVHHSKIRHVEVIVPESTAARRLPQYREHDRIAFIQSEIMAHSDQM